MQSYRLGSTLKQTYSLPEFYTGNVAIEDEWPHLGDFISAMHDDKVDIMNLMSAD